MVQLLENIKENDALKLRVFNRTLSNLTIELQSSEHCLNIDQLVLTKSGIFIVNFSEVKGIFDGDFKRPVWVSEDGERIKNPLIENDQQLDLLKTIIPPYFHPHFYSIVGFRKRVKLNIPGNYKDIESQQWLLSESEIPEYIERLINKKSVLEQTPIKPHHISILERGLERMR